MLTNSTTRQVHDFVLEVGYVNVGITYFIHQVIVGIRSWCLPNDNVSSKTLEVGSLTSRSYEISQDAPKLEQVYKFRKLENWTYQWFGVTVVVIEFFLCRAPKN